MADHRAMAREMAALTKELQSRKPMSEKIEQAYRVPESYTVRSPNQAREHTVWTKEEAREIAREVSKPGAGDVATVRETLSNKLHAVYAMGLNAFGDRRPEPGMEHER